MVQGPGIWSCKEQEWDAWHHTQPQPTIVLLMSTSPGWQFSKDEGAYKKTKHIFLKIASGITKMPMFLKDSFQFN